MLLDGKKVRNEILNNLKNIVENERLDLTLAIIFVGSYAPSEVYVRNKVKYCEKVGIKTKVIRMAETVSEEDIIKEINKLNNDDKITGMIVQSPLPNGLDLENCIKYINPKKDIDGFTKESFYALSHNLPGLRPCTSKGIMRLLKEYNIDLQGKDVVIIGRGNLVGKPLYMEMLNANATVTICHTKTKNLKEKTKNADIIICGAGSPKILTSNMVKRGAIVVDAGITVIDGKIVGDADYLGLSKKCKYITPNPGGVGPMTIAMIIENIIEAYRLGGRKNG
ncbi:MAG: bifunctional 5,10-methylenetetrahydrofolate dehydrogenase/5,10-methenyltetrahydrofolate cyclohydrolase [Firmicutes bacterium]|nr:bifunctional 5,10-methylenetetrahydrofolate dehydrogenase/5,10-methenyltetrahydrofolate cyclohydrolase [Bacillota bacterium]